MKNKNIAKIFGAGILAASLMVQGASLTMQAGAAGDLWECAQSNNEEGQSIHQFKEVELLIPQSWDGLYEYDLSEDGKSVTFYQTTSREAGKQNGFSMGELFHVTCSDNYDFMDILPSYTIIGNGKSGVYYVSLPTGVAYYEADEEITEEYRAMWSEIDWVIDHVTMKSVGEGVVDEDDFEEDMSTVQTGDYLIADSFTRALTKADLSGMNTTQLQMAINEIYARHHRKFDRKEIQDYFNAKSWYSGTIEPEKFDAGVLSLTEQNNISLILSYMSSSPKTSNSAQGGTMYAAVEVNLRAQASTASQILTVVQIGEAVEVTGEMKNGWAPVNYNGTTGYISAEYLSTVQQDREGWGVDLEGDAIADQQPMFSDEGVRYEDNGMGYVHGTVTARDGESFTIQAADGTSVALTFSTHKMEGIDKGGDIERLQIGAEADVVFNKTLMDVEVITVY